MIARYHSIATRRLRTQLHKPIVPKKSPVLAPPYIVEKSHIAELVGTLAAAIKKHA